MFTLDDQTLNDEIAAEEARWDRIEAAQGMLQSSDVLLERAVTFEATGRSVSALRALLDAIYLAERATVEFTDWYLRAVRFCADCGTPFATRSHHGVCRGCASGYMDD